MQGMPALNYNEEELVKQNFKKIISFYGPKLFVHQQQKIAKRNVLPESLCKLLVYSQTSYYYPMLDNMQS